MKDREEERLLKEMDRRTRLWESYRDDAEMRMKRMKTGKVIATIDLQVAVDTLKRIEERKKEILGKTAHKLLSEQPINLFKRVPEKAKERGNEI